MVTTRVWRALALVVSGVWGGVRSCSDVPLQGLHGRNLPFCEAGLV